MVALRLAHVKCHKLGADEAGDQGHFVPFPGARRPSVLFSGAYPTTGQTLQDNLSPPLRRPTRTNLLITTNLTWLGFGIRPALKTTEEDSSCEGHSSGKEEPNRTVGFLDGGGLRSNPTDSPKSFQPRPLSHCIGSLGQLTT